MMMLIIVIIQFIASLLSVVLHLPLRHRRRDYSLVLFQHLFVREEKVVVLQLSDDVGLLYLSRAVLLMVCPPSRKLTDVGLLYVSMLMYCINAP